MRGSLVSGGGAVVTRRAETQISYRQGLLRLGDFLLPSYEAAIPLHRIPSPIQCWLAAGHSLAQGRPSVELAVGGVTSADGQVLKE